VLHEALVQATVFRTDCGFLFDIGMSSVLCIFYSQGIKDIPFMDSAKSGANRAKALDQATDFAKRAKELLYIVVNFLLIVIILRNPMLSSDIDKNIRDIFSKCVDALCTTVMVRFGADDVATSASYDCVASCACCGTERSKT
jgi:hypothetical protein